MNPFEFVIALVSVVLLFKLLHRVLDRKMAWRERATDTKQDDARLDRLEQRMANIETIVLEREKVREFEKIA